MSKKGFTLAEVMVTLAIIGVLGAILIPAVTSSSPDRNKVMFKKAYNTLTNAISAMINDDVAYPSADSGGNNLYGFHNTAVAGNGTTNKFCYYLTQSLNTVGEVTCPNRNALNSPYGWGDDIHFTTSDGVYWRLYFRASDLAPDTQFPVASLSGEGVYPVLVYMDVNGLNQKPNCTASTFGGYVSICPSTSDCSSNPDTFIVDVRYDGKLHVGGYHGGTYTDKCAESILLNPTNNSKDK